MWRNIDNKQIKYSHVKEYMSNRLTLIEAGTYCTVACC